MEDKLKHISNPLTIIAVFCGIAELSGTSVLPFIDVSNQETFIWFLMLFPTLIVILFFVTLNFNYKTLYSPSDYRDDKAFLNALGYSSPDQVKEKITKELEEDEFIIESSIDKRKRPERIIIPDNRFTEYYLAEDLVLREIERELNILFKKNVFLKSGHTRIEFDAVGIKGDQIYFVEIRLISNQFSKNILNRIIRKTNIIQKEGKYKNTKVILIIALVLYGNQYDENKVRNEVKETLQKVNELSVIFRIYKFSDLKEKYGIK